MRKRNPINPRVIAKAARLDARSRAPDASRIVLAWLLLMLALLAFSALVSAAEDGIERKGEGRLFYTTIKIPANAETLYLSGAGAAPKADGTWGTMEEQAVDIFNKFKATLEAEGWSMSDIVQVRVFAVAGEDGMLDFEGFNRGYLQFFGTEDNPAKPVRSFVQVADLVADGWLLEVEIRAARMPPA